MSAEYNFETGHVESHPAAGHGVDNDVKLRLGMALYILSDVLLGVFFVGSYIFLRGYDNNRLWFNAGIPPSLLASTIIMGLIVLSAIAYYLGLRSVTRGAQGPFRIAIAVAVALALADMVVQVALFRSLGFTTDNGTFASSYLLLSGYHIYHLALGLYLGAGVLNRAYHGRYDGRDMAGLTVIWYYWAWMALYGIAFWALLLIQPPTITH